MYTDGSRINDRIGSSALRPKFAEDLSITNYQSDSAYLGMESDATVYFGQLWGIYMGIKMTTVNQTCHINPPPNLEHLVSARN